MSTSDYMYLGKGSMIYSLSKVINPENIFIDDHSEVCDFSFILASDFVKIGKYSRIAPYCTLSGGGQIFIGNFVDISMGVRLISSSDDLLGPYLFTPSVPEDHRNIIKSPINIGDYSFLGSNSVVYPGVTIGEGTIVQPNTIVRKNLSPWSVYGGYECILIGERPFKVEIVSRGEEILSQKTAPAK